MYPFLSRKNYTLCCWGPAATAIDFRPVPIQFSIRLRDVVVSIHTAPVALGSFPFFAAERINTQVYIHIRYILVVSNGIKPRVCVYIFLGS
jgi:hypothetical protein